jgi:hypothetical protein
MRTMAERRPGIEMRKTITTLLAVLSLCCAALAPALAATGCKGGEQNTKPTDRILLFDDVALEKGDLQGFYADGEIPSGSFNEAGYYLSPRFYLFSGDTIRVSITSDSPVRLSANYSDSDSSMQTGLNSIGEENEPSANISLEYFDVIQQTSGGGLWQLTYFFPSSKLPSGYYRIPDGFYQLSIYNGAGQPGHCEYSITLLQG